MRACYKDFVSYRNISNIFEEASPLRDKLMFRKCKTQNAECKIII